LCRFSSVLCLPLPTTTRATCHTNPIKPRGLHTHKGQILICNFQRELSCSNFLVPSCIDVNIVFHQPPDSLHELRLLFVHDMQIFIHAWCADFHLCAWWWCADFYPQSICRFSVDSNSCMMCGFSSAQVGTRKLDQLRSPWKFHVCVCPFRIDPRQTEWDGWKYTQKWGIHIICKNVPSILSSVGFLCEEGRNFCAHGLYRVLSLLFVLAYG
jgi:hypothetical protein